MRAFHRLLGWFQLAAFLLTGTVAQAASVGAVGAIGGNLLPAVAGTVAPLNPVIINTRLALSNQVSTGSLYYAGVETLVSPPWASTNLSVVFAGIYGKSGVGETAIGNVKHYDDAWIEIAGTKYTMQVATSPTFDMASGGFAWTDNLPIILPANTVYRLGWALHVDSTTSNVDDGGPLAMPKSYIQTADGSGDYQNRGASSLAAATRASTGNIASIVNVGYNFPGAPIGIVGTPATQADYAQIRAVVISGMSIDWGANAASVGFAAGQDPMQGGFGGIMRGLASTAHGRVPFMNLAVPGTRLGDLSSPGIDGQAGWTVRANILAAKGNPFTRWVFGGPINDITVSGRTPAQQTAIVDTAIAAMNSRGGRPGTLLSVRPNNYSYTSGSPNGWGWTHSGTDQGSSAGGNTSWTAVNNYILSKPAGVDQVLNVYSAGGDTGTIGNWRIDGKKYTIAAAASGQKTVTFTPVSGGPAPVLGEEIWLNPQQATGAGEKFVVLTVTANGDGTYTATQRSNLAFTYTAGLAAQEIYTDDGVHNNHSSELNEAAIIDNAKATAFPIGPISYGLDLPSAPANDNGEERVAA